MAASSSSSSSSPSPDVTQPQVFINFRGIDVRNSFLDDLVHKMKAENINVFIDKDEVRGLDLHHLLVRIEESKIAIAIFSERYTNSEWCLNELVKISECVARGTLTAIPVFYKLETSHVKDIEGDFGTNFRKLRRMNHYDRVKTDRWEDAIASISRKHGMVLLEHGHMSDRVFIDEMIVEVKKLLDYIATHPEPIRQSSEVVPIRSSEPRQSETSQIPQPNVNSQGCMFNVRELKISDSHNARYWTFVPISESSNEAPIEVAKMTNCYYLEVSGKLDPKELTFGKKYEVVFVVKVEDTMSQWNDPAKVQLMVPEKDLQERELQFADLVKNEWVEIQAGVFVAEPHKKKIAFYLYQHGSHEKKNGLQIKRAIIRLME